MVLLLTQFVIKPQVKELLKSATFAKVITKIKVPYFSSTRRIMSDLMVNPNPGFHHWGQGAHILASPFPGLGEAPLSNAF